MDDVYFAIELHDVPIGRTSHDITGEEPAITDRTVGERVVVPVAVEHGPPVDLEPPYLPSRDRVASRRDDADRRPERHRARPADATCERRREPRHVPDYRRRADLARALRVEEH